ncbi:MAG: PQQ-like beta-propeller repeat protein [Sedimentisphaerales bacterium]|nr:PQQ-like beta-propeller repeat protein [Sedimentisphaerales bacterium]
MSMLKNIKKRIDVVLLGLTITLFCCGIVTAADWPRWRGPEYNGISKETGWNANFPEAGPKILWEKSVGTGFSSITICDGKAYTMGNIDDNDILYCFDAATGNEIWKKSYSCPLLNKNHEGGPCATPTIDGDAIYTFSKDGDVLRFKVANGDIVWHKNLNKEFGFKHPTWHFSGSPLVMGDLVIVNAGTSGVALNKTDGSIAWQSDKGVSGYATGVPFTLNGQNCIAMMVSREVVALNPATGDVLWRFPWKTSYDINAAEPLISGDTIFITSGYNRGCALLKIEANKVTELWQNKNMSNQVNSSVLLDGFVYGFSGQVGGGGKLTCLEFQSGQVKWTQGGMGTGSLMLADGKLIILSEAGKLVIAEASPDKYKEISSAQILSGKCWTMPVLANGRIYARNAAGKFVCIDVSGKS